MTKALWINLPVKDVARSKEFFTKIGFPPDNKYGASDGSAHLVIGNFDVMLFPEAILKTFTRHEIADTSQGSEVLFSFDAESPAEVDEMAKLVTKAGGNVFGPPEEIQGWMYGCGFADPDGHRWNMLYMDMAKMPKM